MNSVLPPPISNASTSRHTRWKAGTNAQHRAVCFFFARDDFDLEAYLVFHTIQKLLPISRITHSTRRDRRAGINAIGIDEYSPLFQALDDPIHRGNVQPLRPIDPFTKSKNPAFRAKFFQGTADWQVSNQKSARESSNINPGKTLGAHSASRISCISASSFLVASFS